MPNLVQLSNELEYVPKEQLAQMSQDPNNRFPQYLILSEIQRRTANEKAYAAAQPQPTTTIAEEVVGEFMQPKGLQAGMPSVSAPTDSFSTEPMGMPASAPMQQPMMGMAGGGLTSEDKLKNALQENTLLSLEKKLGIKIPRKTQELKNNVINKILENKDIPIRTRGSEINIGDSNGLSFYMNPKNEANQAGIRYNKKFASGGLSAFAAGDRTSLESSFDNPLDAISDFASSSVDYLSDVASDRYFDEEGDFNYGTAIGDGLLFVPGLGIIGAGARGLGTLRKSLMAGQAGKKAGAGFIDRTKSGLKGLFEKGFTKPRTISPKQVDKAKAKSYEDAVGRAIDQQKKNLGVRTTDNKQLVNVGKNTLVPRGSANVPMVMKGSPRVIDPKKSLKNLSYPVGAGVLLSRLDGTDEVQPPPMLQDLNSGLGGIAKQKAKKEIDYDLVNLGGIIMGAKNMSELGQGISGLAESSSKRKRDDALANSQSQLLKAQTSKYKADIQSYSFDQLTEEIELFETGISQGSINGEDPIVQGYLQSLFETLAQRRGGSLQDDILKQQQAS